MHVRKRDGSDGGGDGEQFAGSGVTAARSESALPNRVAEKPTGASLRCGSGSVLGKRCESDLPL